MGHKKRALGNIMNPSQGLVRSMIALILLFAYVCIVMGSAFGFVSPDWSDPTFLSIIIGILGYIYGKEVGKQENCNDT